MLQLFDVNGQLVASCLMQVLTPT